MFGFAIDFRKKGETHTWDRNLEMNGFRFFKPKSNPLSNNFISKSQSDKLTISKFKSCSSPKSYQIVFF